MAGGLTISTLNDSSGVLATQNGMSGICKAWVNFNGTGTVAIRSSFNVSSITDNGTGDYTVNFTTAMPDANYSVVGGGVPIDNGGVDNAVISIKYGTTPTTTSVQMLVKTVGVAAKDTLYACVSVFR